MRLFLRAIGRFIRTEIQGSHRICKYKTVCNEAKHPFLKPQWISVKVRVLIEMLQPYK